jgi:hypothetical protein
MTTEERLEKMERELARGKRFNRWVLAGLVLCLGAGVVVWALSRETPGRYAVATLGTEGAIVLDTRTSRLWARAPGRSIYLGTNDNPKNESEETP